MPRKVNYGIDYDHDYDDYEDYDYDDHDYNDNIEEDVGKAAESREETRRPGVWRCSICTYDNDESLSECDICGVLHIPMVNNGGIKDNRTAEGKCKDSRVSIMAKTLFASSRQQMAKKAVLFQQQSDQLLMEKDDSIHWIGKARGEFHEFHSALSNNTNYPIKIAAFKFDVPSPDDLVTNGLLSSKKSSKAVNLKEFKSSKASSGIAKETGGVNPKSSAEMSGGSSAMSRKGALNTVKEPSLSKQEAVVTQPGPKILGATYISMEKGKQVIVEESDFPENITAYLRSTGKGSDNLSKVMPNDESDSEDEGNNLIGSTPHSLASSLNKVALQAKSAYANYVSAKEANSNPLYKPDKWMLPDQARDTLTQLNLAIVGHVDSGKSTLSGRLLHLLGRISQKEMHKYEKEAKIQGKGSFAYAWALDESTEERERGITMTVGVAYLDSKRYHVVVLDSPGHKDFVPNMISGATQADAAILVIDASVGSFEAGMDSSKGQTREHAQLIRSFGVDQLIVAVNKMDVVEYSRDRYDFIKSQLGTFLRSCGFKDSSISWIPLSAVGNQNLVNTPTDDRLRSWFQGPNLLDAIDSLKPPTRDFSKPLLMPICDVIKSVSQGHVSACGKLEAGALRTGSRVLLMPSGYVGTVRSLERDSQPCAIARAGDSVTVSLQGIEGSNVMAGGVLCHPDFPIAVARRLELKVLVLDFVSPILVGSQLEAHIHHAKEAAKVAKIFSLLDPKTGKQSKKSPRCLTSKQSAVIEVLLNGPVCVEAFSTSRALGRVFLRALGRTVAVGIVTRIVEEQE